MPAVGGVLFEEVKGADSILACYPVLRQLRTHLSSETAYCAQVERQMEEGYRIVCLKDGSGAVLAVAGFRIFETFFDGKVCHCDDLVTEGAQRSQGLGYKVLEGLKALAVGEGCVRLRLDSGVQRLAAHRFYEANGLEKTCWHFSCQLT